MSFGMAQAALNVAITGDTRGLDRALNDAAGSVDGFGGSVLGTVGKVAAVGAAAGVAVGAIAAVTSAAADDAAEQARLQAAVEATGLSYADQAEAIDAAIASGQQLAFTDTQVRDALVPLIGATGDMTEAQALLATAQDVARLTGMDLEQASRALIKVNEGNADALARYGITVDEGSTSTEALAQIQAQAAGQAQAYGESTAGSLERMQIGLGEVAESVGAAFLPTLEAILPALMPLLETLGELVEALLPALVPLLKLAAGAISFVARAVTELLRWLRPLIDAIAQAVEGVGELFDSGLGGLLPGGGAKGGGATGASSTSVTIYTGADPASVVRALHTYAGDNGGRMPSARAYGG